MRHPLSHRNGPSSIAYRHSEGDLLESTGTSGCRLEQPFRYSLGSSPQRYIHNCRLRHHPGELQLWDLAFRWGFTQPSRFTSAYKAGLRRTAVADPSLAQLMQPMQQGPGVSSEALFGCARHGVCSVH